MADISCSFTRLLVTTLALGLLASCAAVVPPKTTQLAVLGDPATPRVSQKPYRPGMVPPPSLGAANSRELLVLVAVSGGGKRSAAFSYGVMKALYEAPISAADSNRVLDEVDLISGVSGGAFTAAYYALHRDALFVDRSVECSFESRFLYTNFETYIWGLYLLPWRWGWMVQDSYGSNDEMARRYAERLFSGQAPVDGLCPEPATTGPHGVTFGDLYDRGPPVLLVGATDITKGFVFPFDQDGFDLLCADLSGYPLAWAVAASNGFPPVLSSISLENHHGGPCRADNAWLSDVTRSPPDSGESDVTEFKRSDLLKDVARKYLTPGRAKFAHAMDGGITDNLALRGLSDWVTMHHDQLPGVLGQTKRIVLIIIDGQSMLDPATAERESGPDFFNSLNALISTSIDQYNVETLADAQRELAAIVDEIAKANPDRPRPTARIVHLTLREDCNDARREKLLGLGTSLGLSPEDIDALVATGREIGQRHIERITSALDLENGPGQIEVKCDKRANSN